MHKPKVFITQLPCATECSDGFWSHGFPVYQGESDVSLNYAMLYAHDRHIIPNQQRLRTEYHYFHQTLIMAGFEVVAFEFPESLNREGCLCHDAVFVRDGGIMVGDVWIRSNFAARARQMEADVYADVIPRAFGKELVIAPNDCRIEGGEIIYLKTSEGGFYFGGVSRANEAGHQFVCSIAKPNVNCIIQSDGYHLDTVFTPVLNDDNSIVAFILARHAIAPSSIDALYVLGKEMLFVDPIDASGEGGALGNYAVNALVAPGVLVNNAVFHTCGIEERLAQLGIKRYVTPLTDFKFSGGSVHCLTNEVC